MNQDSLPPDLDVSVAALFGAGAAIVLWRTVLALRSGSVWLRGQKVVRADQPVWFWAYVMTYLGIIITLTCVVCQAVFL